LIGYRKKSDKELWYFIVFTQKIATELRERWVGDLGSEIREPGKAYPGSGSATLIPLLLFFLSDKNGKTERHDGADPRQLGPGGGERGSRNFQTGAKNILIVYHVFFRYRFVKILIILIILTNHRLTKKII
jgi:hypothetical protein